MTQAIKILTLIDVIFILFLIASGSTAGILSDVIYYIGFLVPVFIGYRASGKLKWQREEERGLAEASDRLLEIKKGTVGFILPLIAPTVATIFVSAFLTSLALSSFGFSSAPVENVPLAEMIIVNALAPALLEELLFRYIPMKLIMPYSKRWCLLLSSLYFALIHCSLFQIPYALIAGVIFIVIDMMSGSIWPSVILHFINNLLSVIWIKYCTNPRAVWIFTLILGVCALISLIFALITFNKKYKAKIKGVLDKGESFKPTYSPIALAVISLYIAVLNLLSK